MANNRLYIRDRNTGDTFYFCKAQSPRGWGMTCSRVRGTIESCAA